MTTPRLPVLERAAPWLLFAGFLALYLAGAARLAATPMFERDNVFFRADTFRVFEELTGDRTADLRRTSAHPAFVLLHNPLGRGAARLAEAAGMEPMAARRLAASLLTAAAGALAVALGFRLLRALGLRGRPVAAAHALLLAFLAVELASERRHGDSLEVAVETAPGCLP